MMVMSNRNRRRLQPDDTICCCYCGLELRYDRGLHRWLNVQNYPIRDIRPGCLDSESQESHVPLGSKARLQRAVARGTFRQGN